MLLLREVSLARGAQWRRLAMYLFRHNIKLKSSIPNPPGGNRRRSRMQLLRTDYRPRRVSGFSPLTREPLASHQFRCFRNRRLYCYPSKWLSTSFGNVQHTTKLFCLVLIVRNRHSSKSEGQKLTPKVVSAEQWQGRQDFHCLNSASERRAIPTSSRESQCYGA
jgi:hypothetical protein